MSTKLSAADSNSSDRYRVVGAVGATGMIVASMVGSGIFSLTGSFGAEVATPTNLIVPWILGGILALCGGLALAELGAMIPCSGGSIEFARRAFGSTTGYLVAMVTILSGYILSIAVVGLFLAEYVDNLFDADVSDHTVAVIAILVAFASQLPGLPAGFAFNTALSIVKIGFVALFVIAGLYWPVESRLVATAAATTDAPGMFSPAVANATLAVSFAYLGWSTGADIAGDIRKPGRNVPLSIIASIALVFVLYVGVNFVYLRVIDPLAMTDGNGGPMKAIGGVAAKLLFGESIGALMGAVIALLLFSTVTSGLITGARILESMAQAREIPAYFGVRRTNGVPLRGLVLITVTSLAALAIGLLGDILDMLTVLVNVFSSLSVAAVIVLRVTMKDAPRPFRVPLYPITPIVYLALAGWSIVASVQSGGAKAIVASVITVALLLVLRFTFLHPRKTNS